jgi:hypothetical protein
MAGKGGMTSVTEAREYNMLAVADAWLWSNHLLRKGSGEALRI